MRSYIACPGFSMRFGSCLILVARSAPIPTWKTRLLNSLEPGTGGGKEGGHREQQVEEGRSVTKAGRLAEVTRRCTAIIKLSQEAGSEVRGQGRALAQDVSSRQIVRGLSLLSIFQIHLPLRTCLFASAPFCTVLSRPESN
eukprot:320724-Rhodomonas_salina.1